MFDTFPRYDVFKNTAIYFCNVKIYYTIDLWTSPTYSCCLAMQDVPLLCAWLTTYPKHGPCMILQRNVKTRLCLRDNLWPFWCTCVCAAAPLGFWGLLRSFAAFVAAQREPAKSTSSGARNVDGKWQEQQDQRAIQSRDVNNGSYLVTWVTSCSSRQPLPNLWTSLVRAEPQQSPCVTLCTCCEHRASFADIFASRKVPGHWPCLPQAGGAVRQHRRAHRRWRSVLVSTWNARFSTSLVGVCSLFIEGTCQKRISARRVFSLMIL